MILDTIISGKHHEWGSYVPGVAPRITCADGTTLSVQASRWHYCEPRDDIGPYTSVEVGALSAKMPWAWKRYAAGGVYAYVPVKLVRKFIAKHGGET